MSVGVVRLTGVSRRVRLASVNVNGIRAAVRKGMLEWLDAADIDILTLQEVRATREELLTALPGWQIENDEAAAKGRAGVAVAARVDALETRRGLGDDDGLDAAGRWIEADYDIGGQTLTVVSAYVPTGEADTPRQEAKWVFLDAMERRMGELSAAPFAVVTGDLNVGHRELDIRNWKGNVKKSGFLPRERAYFDRWLGEADADITGVDGSVGRGLGWVDVGRAAAGDIDGPYSWWTMRGRAFDNDTGWRIDYQLATPRLAATAADYHVVRAPSWDTRWSDHAPVVADYHIGE